MTSRLSVVDLVVGHDSRRPAAAGLSFEVDGGESLAIQGPSGSGKTSLLMSVNGLLPPLGGRVLVDGVELWSMPDRKRSKLRREQFGYVFQFGEMLPELSVRENVALPLLLQGETAAGARDRARSMLARLGVDHLADQDIRGISGGELQRVAVARAVVHAPSIVLADEPTGSLDPDNARLVMDLLVESCRDERAALIVVTHDASIAAMTEHTISLGGDRTRCR